MGVFVNEARVEISSHSPRLDSSKLAMRFASAGFDQREHVCLHRYFKNRDPKGFHDVSGSS